MALSEQERARRLRERRMALGERQINEWVPEGDKPLLRRFAAELRERARRLREQEAK